MSEPTPVPDVREPVPDLGHEMLRQSVVASLDDLTAKTDQLTGALLLARTSLDFAQTFLNAVVPLQQALADLTARVDALENPPAPPTP